MVAIVPGAVELRFILHTVYYSFSFFNRFLHVIIYNNDDGNIITNFFTKYKILQMFLTASSPVLGIRAQSLSYKVPVSLSFLSHR